MSLELLNLSTKTVPNFTGGAGAYVIKSWDAFICYGSKIQKVFLDGTTKVIGSPPANITMGGRSKGRATIEDPLGKKIWPINEVTGVYDYNINLVTPGAISGIWSGGFVVDEADLYLDPNGTAIDFYQISTSTKFATLASVLSSGNVEQISCAGPGKALAGNRGSGRVALIDYVKREVLWRSKVNANNRAISYNPNHDVIVTIGTDNKVRIYGLNVVPNALSAPALDPVVAHVHCLEGRTVKTRLTGDDGEPCPDWWITWELLGAPPKGALEKGVSKTDANGYAWNIWFTPADPADVGSETIKVSLEV